MIRLPKWAIRALDRRALLVRMSRKPDFVIGEGSRPYLLRWWILPRNPLFNIYLHEVLRSDDDRALHDHPWLNCSIIVSGRYVEHEIMGGGIERRTVVDAGSIRLRFARAAHRLEILPGEHAITLFITGLRLRSWGFHCPKAGWVHWKDFVADGAKGQIGKGCGE